MVCRVGNAPTCPEGIGFTDQRTSLVLTDTKKLVTVDAVIDLGFNIKIKHRLRLSRIDTPELRAKKKSERAAALTAKNFVASRLLERDVIISTEKSDSFGRYLAEIFYTENDQQKNISDVLLNFNLAKLYKK